MVTKDIHCVTKWSKFDTHWEGVSLDTLLAQVTTNARYVIAFSDGGYTTNLPLDEVTGGQAWVVDTYEGQPLAPEHGGPARLLVPHLYFWKSAKWVRGLRLVAEDEPGFWESLGYNNHGDPWKEERYWATDLAARRGGRHAAGNGAHEEHHPHASQLDGASSGATRRCAAHRRGRLPGRAQLFDRLATGGDSAHDAHRRTNR